MIYPELPWSKHGSLCRKKVVMPGFIVQFQAIPNLNSLRKRWIEREREISLGIPFMVA